jgi:hypothetical protein
VEPQRQRLQSLAEEVPDIASHDVIGLGLGRALKHFVVVWVPRDANSGARGDHESRRTKRMKGSSDLASVKLEFFAPQYFGIFLHERNSNQNTWKGPA